MAMKYTPKNYREKEEKEQENRAKISTKTTAGTKPAVGVSAKNNELGKATSFAEYSALRRKQEEEDGMRSAANKLAGQYGYKRVGNQAVFVTPNSPLPAPTAQNTATKAQAPGAYGMAPSEYASLMSDVNRYVNQRYDDETQEFLDQYFGGQLPDENMFESTFKHYARGGVETEPDVMNFHRGAELVRKATEEKADAKAGYEKAIGVLGEDAAKYLSQNESDYYERFGNTYGAAEALNKEEPLDYHGYGDQNGISYEDAKKYTNSPYANQGNDRFALQRWSQTTQQERDAYQLMREMYGEEAAESYMQSLEPELNKRLAASEEERAKAFAEQNPLWSNLKTIVTAPIRGMGVLEMGVEKLMGNEVDLYDPRLNLAREAETIREETAGGMGGVGSFLYNTGMSMADNIANMALWGGLGSIATMVSMGGNSAASAFNDAVKRGADQNQATKAAVLSGVAEALFEKFSLDNVITMAKGGGLKNAVGNIAKQMGIEASEEFATGIANEISDRLVMNEKSNYELAVQQYMENGMTEDEAKRTAWMGVAKEIGLGALGGALSGGVMGAGGQGIAALNRKTQLELEAAARQLAEDQQKTEPEVQQPQMPAPENKTVDAREKLMAEYAREDARADERMQREEERGYMPKPAQEEAQQAKTNEVKEEPMPEEKPAEEASEGENEQRFTQARGATMRDEDGVESRVNVVGVMMNDETPVLITENENGETDYALADDLIFDDEMGELLGYEGVKNMDARGLRNYLEGWDGETAPEEYARAYASVYQRAGAGLDYDQAAMQNESARSSLTEDARMSAYAAGMNAYNQTHDTVSAANIETVEGTVDENAQMSAKETPNVGRLSRRYTMAAFGKLGKNGRNNAVAQMELLAALASRTGHTITVVDSIVGKNGKAANATYNPETREIRVALDATGGAYAYAAMHELTHAVRNEHASEWDGFKNFVRDGLKANGQNWDQLVSYQMNQFGYDQAAAEEEVICNTVPALLQDERNVLKLYKGNRTLFNRVVDWVKGLLKDVKAAGKQLSTRSKSWAQMDALKNDRELLQGMYDRLMAVMEKNAETSDEETRVVKLSAKDESDSESQTLKEQLRTNSEAINRLPIAASVQTAGKQGKSDAQLTKEILDEYKASGFEVERQGFGKVSFGEREVDKAVHYANNDAEYAAILAAKKVVKRGIEINERHNHKGRRYDSTTFAAPVEVNGKKGIEAVLVKKTKGNRFTVARILAPDGTAFVFENKKDAEPTTGGGRPATEAAAVYTPISPASDNSVAENSENVKFSYMGENAKTADIRRLEEAKSRLSKGESTEAIRKETGWFRGMDSKWRFETDDSHSQVRVSENNYRKLGEVLEHEELMRAYPDLANIDVIFQALDGGMNAQYNRTFDSIDVAYKLKNKPKELRKSLLHEIQHAIQAREDFTRGATPRYWQKRMTEGFDARRTKDKNKVQMAQEKLTKLQEERPKFYQEMMKLSKMSPDVPRAPVNWDTLETIGEDPVEWQRYDAFRESLEEKYGFKDVMDFIALESIRDKGDFYKERTPEELYMDTAGEIEARDVAERVDMTPEERKAKGPYLGDEDTVFSDKPLFYSLRDTDENVQDALSTQQQAFQQVRSHRITAAEADKLAGEVLKEANSDYDRKKLAEEISRIFDYIERGEDINWNQVDDEMTDLMARVMEKSRTLDLEHEEMAKPIRDYLRKTGIRLTESQRKEAESLAGSYGAYRKGLFGRVRLVSTGGTPLDSLWGELSSMNPELFPEGASEGEMTSMLMYAVDALKPVYHTGMGMNVEESASWLAGKLNEAYFSLPAVKAAAQDARTFGDSIRDLKAAMKRFEETSWSEYQNALQSIQKARTAENRTQKQKETEAMRAKYQNWRDRDTAARKEREMKAKYRTKIERTANVLSGWLMKPTDAKHVPAGVEDSVRRMLESLDFSGKTTKTAEDLSAKINGLADALLNAQEGEDENRTIFLERDQQMIDELRRVAELIRGNTEHQQMEGRGVYELNGMELRELSKWLDVVRHVVTETSKLRGSNLPGESVEQVAQMSMLEMSSKKAWKDKKWATKQWLEHFGPDMQDSFAFFERMGPTANAIFKGLRSGFDKVTQLTRQAEKHTKTILEGVNLKELTGKKAKKQTFTLQKGGQLEMTKAQIMELYVLSKREQAQGHIYGEGIRIQGDEDVRARQMTKADVAAIIGTLTEDEKRVADGMQKFLSKECASWGNETSMKLLGYRKFGEEFYWPIRTDSNTRNTTKLEDNYAANISAIKNQGMTKATIEGAKNAIVVGDIFDTYTRHISNMAAYAGYALPLSDFTRWYNSRGVKTEIEQLMGKNGLKYINNFLMAVNGSSLQADKTGIEKLTEKLTRNAKIASVGANARVVIQQPTSYARAAMYISPKYLSQALAMRGADIDLVNRYCGIAQWKSWGFYETNIGPNLRQMIVGDESISEKMREASTWLAGKGDEWTLKHLWNACELETQELYPELQKGSEEYYQQVGERMSELVDRTQVVDSVFHRSQMMRSKSGTAQLLTNFMAEPTKTYNMLMSAISDYADNRKNKAARNRVARALTVYAVTGLMTAAAAAVIDAFRDDDADEEWAEKYLEAVGANTADNLNPFGLLPGVKDVLSLIEGYEPSRLDTQSIQRILWAAQEIEKYVNGTSKQNLYGVSYKVMQAVSSTLGIPLSNLLREGNAIIQTVTGESPILKEETQKAGKVTRLYNALEAGEKAKANKLREELRLKAGMTPKEIDTAIAQKLEADPKIKEAYEAKTAKDFATMNRAINALTAKGYSKEVVEKAITNYANDQKPKETKTKDPGEQLSVTFYTEADVVSAMKVLAGVEKGGSVTEADVKAMISERVAGSDAKDPEKSVKNGIQSEIKKAYLEAEAKGNTSAMKKLGMVMKNVLGTTQDTMNDWVRTQHADNLRTAVNEYNKTAALKAVTAMRRDGKTDSEIKSSLSKYKQLYIDAVKRKDMATANRIKAMLKSLDLKSKKGESLYTDKHFEDWLKEK